MTTNPVLTRLNLKKHVNKQRSNSIDPPSHDFTIHGTTARTPHDTAATTVPPIYDVHKYNDTGVAGDDDNGGADVGKSTDTLATTRTERPRTSIPSATPSSTLTHPLHCTRLDDGVDVRPSKQVSSKPGNTKYDNVKSKLYDTTVALKLRAEASKQPEPAMNTYKSHRPSITGKVNMAKRPSKPQTELDAVVQRMYKLIDQPDVDSEHKTSEPVDDSAVPPSKFVISNPVSGVDVESSIDFDKHSALIDQSMQQLQQKKLSIEHNRARAKLHAHYVQAGQTNAQQCTEQMQVQLIALQQARQQSGMQLNDMRTAVSDKIAQLQRVLADIEQKWREMDDVYRVSVERCKGECEQAVSAAQRSVDDQMQIAMQQLDLQHQAMLSEHVVITADPIDRYHPRSAVR